MEVIAALASMVKRFPKAVSKLPTELLQSIWACLTVGKDAYLATVANADEEADPAVDSDGNALGLAYQITGLFELLQELCDHPKHRATLQRSLDELAYLLVQLMQITNDQVASWTADVNQYLQDIDDETFSFAVRTSALQLLLDIEAAFPNVGMRAVCAAVSRVTAEAHARLQAQDPLWWKSLEAAMSALEALGEPLEAALTERAVDFDLGAYFNSVAIPAMQQPRYPFPCGRALRLASKLLSLLPEGSLTGRWKGNEN